jgi:hypothetical protein
MPSPLLQTGICFCQARDWPLRQTHPPGTRLGDTGLLPPGIHSPISETGEEQPISASTLRRLLRPTLCRLRFVARLCRRTKRVD